MSYQLITTNAQLAEYCSTIANANAIALDTEFVRTKTFYPHLGLLQVFDGQSAALIDPLQITQWQPFLTLLSSPAIEKYFHSCSEDIDVFLSHFKCIPSPIIDSQVLASFLDNPVSGGYASLVQKYLGIELDKSETRTDWLKRPLTEKQCDYAINDVLYLLPLMTKLKALLVDNGYLGAAYQECEMVIKRKCETVDPKLTYLQIKNSWQLSGESLSRLQKLAEWRYCLAKANDIAINFVVHEDVLWQIAKYRPSSLGELSHLGMKGKELRLYGQAILAILAEPTQDIAPIKRIIYYPNYKTITAELKQASSSIAKQTGLNESLLLSKRLIEQYIRWLDDNTQPMPAILSSWRKPLFEKYCSSNNIE